MASVTHGTHRFYYRGGQVVYPYDEGSPSERAIRAYCADPQGFEVAEPRLASTVMLVREGRPTPDAPDAGRAPQVFMLHRVSTMDFAADAYVFPGGRVDESDRDTQLPWAGPTPAEWAERMGLDEGTARAVVTAAAREMFEECGVLLASDDSGAVGVPQNGDAMADRVALAAHEASLADVLCARGMVLRTDLLSVLSRWITPVAEPRRYDAFFFAALLPEGACADGNTSEASESRWVRPQAILERFRADQTLLLPPTVYHLEKLRVAESARGFASLQPRIEPVLCESAIIGGEAVSICPRA